MIDCDPQHGARLALRFRILQRLIGRQRQQHPAGHGAGRDVRRTQARTRLEMIIRIGRHRASVGLVTELGPIAQQLEQALLELAQHGLEPRRAAQPRQRDGVVRVELRLRIVRRGQLEQQLVEVEGAAHALGGHGRRRRPVGLGGGQRGRLAPADPGEQHGPEGLESRKARARAARGARESAEAPVVARVQLDDQAGVAVRTPVQHVAAGATRALAPLRLIPPPAAAARGHRRPSSRAP